MKNFIITGTSGVGKTFVEIELETNYKFYQLIKYMDRSPRQAELHDPKYRFLSKGEYTGFDNDDKFAFTLEYMGNRYGWTKEDVKSHSDSNLTIGVTLESLRRIFDSLPDFIPIYLHVEKINIDLLKQRLVRREDYSDLDDIMKKVIDQKIQKRVDLALFEAGKYEEYKKIVEDHGGRVFNIQNDNTVFDEVIPYILKVSGL